MSCCPPCCLPSCSPCPPCCVIPSCASVPRFGLGSGGFGYGGYGSGGFGYGGYGYGGAASASSLGIVPGANVGCVNQIPSSEVVIQPPPCVVTIPGPILAATCEPVTVGGYSPCAPALGGRLSGGYGRSHGAICRPRRRSSSCKSPC